jgi:hypothetical protein
MKKILGSAAFLLVIGYSGFWYMQAKKLQFVAQTIMSVSDNALKNDNKYAKYDDKLSISGYPFNIKIVAKNFALGSNDVNSKVDDVQSNSQELRAADDIENAQRVIIDSGILQANIFLTDFRMFNKGFVKVFDRKNQLIKKITSDTSFEVAFNRSPISISFLKAYSGRMERDSNGVLNAMSPMYGYLMSLANALDAIKLIKLSNKGFNIYDVSTDKVTEFSKASNIFMLEGGNQNGKYNINLKINLDNRPELYNIKPSNAEKPENSLAVLFASVVDLDMKVFDVNNIPRGNSPIVVDLNKFNWKLKDSEYSQVGKFEFIQSKDLYPFGLSKILIKNKDKFIDALVAAYNDHNEKMTLDEVNALKSVLNMIANKVSNNGQDLEIIYSRDKENSEIKIGNKSISEINQMFRDESKKVVNKE